MSRGSPRPPESPWLLFTLEGVLEEVRRMARVVADNHEPRLRWRLGMGVVSAATVGALLFALLRLASIELVGGCNVGDRTAAGI
jgi:hypothetical protein